MPIADDLDELVSPPLPGKEHPPSEMDEVTPTLDDEVRRYHHHPNDAGSTAFGCDPDAADAAADLAGDLGSDFLSGATRGEDMSEVTLEREDRDEQEDLPFVIDLDMEPRTLARPVARRRHR